MSRSMRPAAKGALFAGREWLLSTHSCRSDTEEFGQTRTLKYWPDTVELRGAKASLNARVDDYHNVTLAVPSVPLDFNGPPSTSH